MRDEFLLEPNVVFLNHGSFGACPRDVHDDYQRWQRRLESQPVRFIQRELPDLITHARQRLADYVGADLDEIVFVPNPTFAVNEIARALSLTSDDEVLMSNHEYGACVNAWRFMSHKRRFKIVAQPIPLPCESTQHFVDDFWRGVSERTRLIFLSHITSPTAMTFPVAEICARARERNILTVIDGAHAPGQIEVDLHDVGADFYVATCHKWMCAPKGTAFFYARRERQHLIEPLIVGWGWGDDRVQFKSESDFVDHHQWLGTHDPSGYLTVPTAIDFQRSHDWPNVRQRCHALANLAVELATSKINSVRRVHHGDWFQQMALIELTKRVDVNDLKQRLYDRHHVEVPVIEWNSRQFVRVSAQAYNTSDDIERFVAALVIELA